MWQIINVEPADGECSICRSHECGIVDGKHQWIMSDYLGQETDRVYIGYKCVKLFAENLGMTKEVVEKIVHVPPADEQILHAIKNELDVKYRDVLVIPASTIHPNIEYHEEPKNKTTHRGKGTVKK